MANIFDVHGDVSLGVSGTTATTAIDWGNVQTTLNSSPLAEALRRRGHASQPQMIPMPEPIMSDNDIAKFRGQLLLKLLDIESTRCNAKTEEDERTESLAQVLEGGDHIVSRIHVGMEKYMTLLGIHEEGPPVLSIAEMQESSVFGQYQRPRREGNTVVEVSLSEAETWDRIKRELGRHGLSFERMSLMGLDTNLGGRSSPEDQLTCTFRILR